MAYTDAATVKTYGGNTTSADDTLITALITRAQAWIDQYTGRTFEASDTTKYFTVGVDTCGDALYFGCDCAAITTVKNDADGANTTVTSAQYVTLPRNSTPYYGIRLLPSAGLAWSYSVDAETGIAVTGKWAYSATAPADIVHACVRLTEYLYKQRDAQVFDVTAQPDMGVITVPMGMPADVAKILEPYRRHL